MDNMIRFLLSNFTLTLLVLGVLAAAVSLLRTPRPWTALTLVEALFSYFILFSIAINYFYNFVANVFCSEATHASSVGQIAHSRGRLAPRAWASRSSGFWRSGVALTCALQPL